MKKQLKATTYKDIKTDMKEDMSYIDFKKGEKLFTDNELKWFVSFHNMKTDAIENNHETEALYRRYVEMLSVMAFNKRYDIKFNFSNEKREARGVVLAYYSSYTDRWDGLQYGESITLCLEAIKGTSGFEGRESLHQHILSSIRHEMCHWYLHTTGSNEWSDGERAFEMELYRVDADSTRCSSVEESKKLQMAFINNTYNKMSGVHNVSFKSVKSSGKYNVSSAEVEKIYDVIDKENGEKYGTIVKTNWNSYVSIDEDFLATITDERMREQMRNLERAYPTRKKALKELMDSKK